MVREGLLGEPSVAHASIAGSHGSGPDRGWVLLQGEVVVAEHVQVQGRVVQVTGSRGQCLLVGEQLGLEL